MVKRKKIDLNSPLANELREKIGRETFISEGIMVAFPLCFPGASTPITADEAHITALDVTARGIVYGGTSGRQTHLFAASFDRASGVVFDTATIKDASHCAAICCGKAGVIACVNGPGGGRFIRQQFHTLHFGLIQEWNFYRPPFDELGEAVKGEKLVHAVADIPGKNAVASTEHHLVSVDIESGKIEVLGKVAGSGRLAVGSKGNIFGLDEVDTLWRCNPEDGTLTRNAVKLPAGSWRKFPLMWARDSVNGNLYTADGDGHLFSFTEEKGFSPRLGQTPLTPVGPMAVTFDGRLFGTCGEEICRFFCHNPDYQKVTDLGVAVSVIERRRYGYMFGDAVVGSCGQIFFGEDDDLGHLWIYFPRIQRNGSPSP